MRLAGVVVLYNPTKSVLKNIDSYVKKVEKLYVIDNSSNDNSGLFKDYKKILYISFGKNEGIAKALNEGAKNAIDGGYDYLLTMDQDSNFKNDNLDKLINFTERMIKKYGNKLGLVSPWHSTKENKIKPNKEYDEVLEEMTSGNIISLDAWKKVKGFKEWFFIDNVDIEYCMNLNKNNYKVIIYYDSILLHDLGNITKKKFLWKTFYCTNHNYLRQYYMIRNLYYLNELYGDIYPEKIKSMKRGAFGRFKNIVVWENDKFRKIRGMYRGYKDYKKKVVGIYPYKN
jgi:rhamnosyltransferase